MSTIAPHSPLNIPKGPPIRYDLRGI